MENIFLTKDDVPDFKEYLKDPSLKLLSERKDGDYVIRIYNSDQTFHIPNELLKLIESEYSNPIIFGKDTTENIVSVEVENGQLHLFKEYAHGIEVETRPYKYWFITPKKVSSKQIPLAGNQHYKYIAYFNNEEEFNEAKKVSYRHDMWTIWDNKEAAMVHEGITYFKGMKVQDVSVLSFDIETDGLSQTNNSEIYIITNTFRKKDKIIRKSFFLDDFQDQAEMLIKWIDWVNEMDPSLIIGHNIYSYDFPYIMHVAELHGVDLTLGRDNSVIYKNSRTSQFRKDGSQSYEYHKLRIFGREIVDTFFLSMKYDIGRKFESYGLKSIVRELRLEKDGRSFVDAGKIKVYYKERKSNPEMWDKVKKYAEEDSDDALKLYDLMAPSFFYMTQSIGKTYQEINTGATGAQINSLMVRAYLQKGHSIAKADESIKFEGGTSFAVPGVYKYLKKLDISSCYPHQILRFRLHDKNKDPEAYFYYLVKHFTESRIKNKTFAKNTGERYYKDLEQSQKILINSFFGACGASGLNYNSPKIAAKITEESRKVIDLALVWASGKNTNYWMEEFRKKTGKSEESMEDDLD